MTPPLSRQAQIHLMETTKERLEETAKRHMAHPQLRAAMAQPAPGQPHDEEELPPELEAAVNRFIDGFKREYRRLVELHPSNLDDEIPGVWVNGIHLYRERTPAEERKLRKGREAYERYYRQSCWKWPHETS